MSFNISDDLKKEVKDINEQTKKDIEDGILEEENKTKNERPEKGDDNYIM